MAADMLSDEQISDFKDAFTNADTGYYWVNVRTI